MENFCGCPCEECVAVLEGGFFHSVLCHSRGEHQRGTFFPKCVFGLLVLARVVLQEQCLFQVVFWRLPLSWLSHQRSLRRQELSQPTGGSIHLPQVPISGSPLHGLLRRDTAVIPWKTITNCPAPHFFFISLKIAVEGDFPPFSEFPVSLQHLLSSFGKEFRRPWDHPLGKSTLILPLY